MCTNKPNRLHFPNPKDKSLGAELKRKRLALKWPQNETANYFGVLKDSYQNWEWNEYIPHIKNRKKVVDFLGYNFWDDGTNSIANKCLLYRIEKGIVRRELAKLIGISEMTMDRIENNKLNISQKTILKIEKLLLITENYHS